MMRKEVTQVVVATVVVKGKDAPLEYISKLQQRGTSSSYAKSACKLPNRNSESAEEGSISVRNKWKRTLAEGPSDERLHTGCASHENNIRMYRAIDPTLREYMLFGKITISDTYGVLYDGWGLPDAPGRGTVTLFDCDWGDQIRVDNHGKLELGNPSSTHLVPLSSFMEISTELYATTLKEDALFPLTRIDVQMKLTYFWEMEADTKCDMLPLKGKVGDVWMYYVLLKDAMDCAIEVTHDFKEDRKVKAEIYAYYGSDFFDTNEDPFVKNFYTALPYEDRLNSKIAGKVGEDTLKRSMMDVPDKGSIVIKSRLHDYDSKEHGYLDGSCTFDAQPQGSSKRKYEGLVVVALSV
ncbi:hypothetical protein Tco_0903632 [Tanacetum coccineum]